MDKGKDNRQGASSNTDFTTCSLVAHNSSASFAVSSLTQSLNLAKRNQVCSAIVLLFSPNLPACRSTNGSERTISRRKIFIQPNQVVRTNKVHGSIYYFQR